MRPNLVLAAALLLVAWTEPRAGAAEFSEAPGTRGFVLKESGGDLVCSSSNGRLTQAASAVQVHPINHLESDRSPQAKAALTVQLRGTAQLDTFPPAKAAFVRAASQWESLVQSPVTVIIDVDFGPNRFGVPFPAGVLGSTNPDSRLSANGYPAVRSSLLTSFPSSPVYPLLPMGSVPTDLGNVTSIASPSSSLRVLGLLSAAADPNGLVPSIGFNSAFSYDFDPSDGIDAGRRDFEAVAVHEIGHALGFVSQTGLTEVDSTRSPTLSTWDIFRFRPATAQTGFTTAPRILSSGGFQVFSRGSTETGLSTGSQDVPEPSEHRIRADPGHCGVRDLPVKGGSTTPPGS